MLHLAVDGELPLLALHLGDGVQDHPRGEREPAEEHEGAGEHGGGQAQDQPGAEELGDHGDAGDEAQKEEQQGDQAEELHGPVVLEQPGDGHDHLRPVGERGELRLRALGPVAVDDGHIEDAPAPVDRVDRQLGLDLEPVREDGEGLHERAGERAVARHDVVEGVTVDPLDHGADKVVAESVERALVLLRVRPVGEAVAHGHVRVSGEDGLAQGARGVRGVGVVPVDHEVAVGVDVAEHLADDVALALARLGHHDGARGGGQLGGAVGGVVVVDEDRGARQLPAEVRDDLPDGDLLVVAGDEDGDAAVVKVCWHRLDPLAEW